MPEEDEDKEDAKDDEEEERGGGFRRLVSLLVAEMLKSYRLMTICWLRETDSW